MILSVAEIPKIQVSGRYVWSESGADLMGTFMRKFGPC